MQFRITAMNFQPYSSKLQKSFEVKSFYMGNAIKKKPASNDADGISIQVPQVVIV